MEITHTANVELSSELAVGAITAVIDSIGLPPDRRARAFEVLGAYLEATATGEAFAPPPPVSSGIGAAPYVDNGAMYIDGLPGSGLRYRVARTERQPGAGPTCPPCSRLLLPTPTRPKIRRRSAIPS
ncbi:hypothetical protein ACIRBZ_18790 [Streptomyces sp. NPDC094038]|uniref:hypothetical protein n=1 Tax=Streptomyces sp. NPDC094038 TaxID=3366055 RepID=UPI00382843FA